MRRRFSSGRLLPTVTVGWLFADLLLALAMLFLAANTITVARQVVVATPTPTPTPIATPTPKPPPRLETKPHRFSITIDASGLLAGSPAAINDVKAKIRSQQILRGHDVGIAIVYGGSSDSSDAAIGYAQAIAQKIYHILDQLGQEGFAFSRASYYDDLFTLYTDPSKVAIDVFLYNQT